MKIKIKQLGNGGAFDYNQTNSSFLIETDKVILFDCGYNVFSHLMNFEKEFIRKIDYVYISHMDDDHIGSLKTLIYYRFFKLGLKTIIISGNYVVRNDLREYLKYLDKKYQGGEVVGVYMFSIVDIDNLIKDNYLYEDIIVNHAGTPCSGLLIKEKSSQKVLAISGDTKATTKIEKQIADFNGSTDGTDFTNTTIYHDFSHWDVPSKQVHACNTDFEAEYTEKFKSKVIKYHTGDTFNPEWREI